MTTNKDGSTIRIARASDLMMKQPQLRHRRWSHEDAGLEIPREA
jgi:hypothetical protein